MQKKQIEASAKKVSDQVLRSNDRLLKAEKDFKQKNETLTGELHTLKDEVSKELEKLKWRDQLMLLTDEAISYGKRSSFEEIERLVKTFRGTEKEAIVLSYLSQVKKFFINIDRFKSRSITKAGVKIVPNSLSTDVAIIALLNSNDKIVRFKIAKMLSKRKELGIPEALLKSVENDECLDVVAQSVKSFETITGFDAPDVFSYVPLLKYWEENKDEVQKKLKKTETKQNNEVKSN